jgi:hypothetical protein
VKSKTEKKAAMVETAPRTWDEQSDHDFSRGKADGFQKRPRDFQTWLPDEMGIKFPQRYQDGYGSGSHLRTEQSREKPKSFKPRERLCPPAGPEPEIK